MLVQKMVHVTIFNTDEGWIHGSGEMKMLFSTTHITIETVVP